MSCRTLVVSLAGLLLPTLVTAADPPARPMTEFAGWYEIERGVAEKRIESAAAWKEWLAGVPRRVPGATKGLDAVNDNPVLTRRIDWTKEAVVVVASADAVPTIVRVVERNGVQRVEYTLEDDFSSRPVGWGTQSVRIVPRAKAAVAFRVVKPAG